MEYILWFDQITKDNFGLVGGKGFNLGIMTQLNLPVPPGFNITTKAFDEFLQVSGLKDQIKYLIDACDMENTEQLIETSNKIKELITSQDIPMNMKSEIGEAYRNLSYSDKIVDEQALRLIASGRDFALVAVRSSATAEDLPTASFAGQQATFLNVKGIKDLIESVRKCWASLYEPRAIFYRAKNNISDVSICAVIQRMVNSEKSGVMFTIDPTTNEDKIIIEACWGLGETIVQGEVEPDHYTVSKDGKILEKKIGKKLKRRIRDFATDKTIEVPVPKNLIEEQVLTEEQVLKLADYGLKLEKHYNKAQDIEFAIESNRIYIVQTRAVTTEAKKEDVKISGEPILKGLGASPGTASGVVVIVRSMDDLAKVQKGNVLVTKMTSPDMVVAMNRSTAIVTDEGGVTCHAAIVSREMGIPCVVGTENATEVLKEGEIVTVNASNGLVYRGKMEEEKAPVAGVSAEEVKELKTKTKILMNLGVPEKIDEYKDLPFQGIGLMRIEFIIASHIGEHPNYLLEIGEQQKYIDKLAEGIAKVAQTIQPRFVVVRFSDFKTNEYKDLKGGEKYEPKEDNPMLGWRGVSRYVSPEFEKAFRLECKAIKKVRDEMNLKNVWVMIPFVRTTWEVEKCLKIMGEEGLEKSDDFKIWLMAEVPSIILLAEEFCKLCDGFSIGSNDLTQLTLGADRDSSILGKMGYFDERDIAVLRSITHLIKVAHANNVSVSICGQGPSVYKELCDFLVRNGIDSLSLNPDTVVQTKKFVYEIEQSIELEKKVKDFSGFD
jgi:pyruvate,water dikinase